MDFLKILFLLQNDRFMEITEAFHPQTPIATPMGVNNVDPDPTGGRGLLHEGRGNPPKRSPNCNGHPASSSIQVYRDGEISFIPLQERGIILHGKPMFISFHYNSVLNTSYLTESYIVFTLKMESLSKNTIFGLKMMVKSGLEKIFLIFLHAER